VNEVAKRRSKIAWLVVVGLVALACGARQNPAERAESARPAVLALSAGRFDEAARDADDALGADPDNSRARAVRAIAVWVRAADDLVEIVLNAAMSLSRGRLDVPRTRDALASVEARLERVDADLAVAAKDPTLALPLCIACWKGDWNHDGRADRRDERLLEIEYDANGEPIDEGDPRRRPTFRFDIGDAHWARAMVAFQRAALDLVLAYRWSDVADFERHGERHELVVHLDDRGRVGAARDRILEGLDHSDRARLAYLAETDDDREWVPSPRQKDHPIPFRVDAELYATWEAVVGDVRRLVRSEEGIDVRELLELSGDRVKARGFIDVGKLLSSPEDRHVDVAAILDSRDDPQPALRAMFGSAYVQRMPPSRLTQRLARMAEDVRRGDELLGKKLRYLVWLN
jgi:hypothetical protein